MIFDVCIGVAPSQYASGKWKFSSGFPTKKVTILVVTVTGRVDNPIFDVCMLSVSYVWIDLPNSAQLGPFHIEWWDSLDPKAACLLALCRPRLQVSTSSCIYKWL